MITIVYVQLILITIFKVFNQRNHKTQQRTYSFIILHSLLQALQWWNEYQVILGIIE